ncbi:chemotaxis response regulator protein-glutamate methylesterase [Herminiimonas sp. KBW02]|uniref:chemotaxis response regulator protein-glutamate methylesterase n=1 Tax=Herminiimonas sp. KBW02 TaxID=2153363 RepID=UPI000F5959A0|nr:chemotaxis response regulator protein-glutamate methylesterase [Herminiimonas sp. KBW02]RQO37239.1 chemotaxis response regulator protein-glutamate methylesterase [Herminiimonas sp. KBW02]
MKIGIVNDVPMVVEILRRALAEHPAHQLIWVAQDGVQAAEMCAWQLPDVVLMDIIMPNADGAEATRRIMQKTPCPILLVTADISANAVKVYEALGYGALDVVTTPVMTGGNFQQGAAALIAKIEKVARMSKKVEAPAPVKKPAAIREADPSNKLVVIGASAGGPAALAELLRGLPTDFPAAVVIVQHINSAFVDGMADWLQQQTALRVRVAKEGDQPLRGTVFIAGTNQHLLIKNRDSLGYVAESPMDIYHPSIDVLFHSVVQQWQGKAVGVLLTGMGRDGALGLKAMHDHKYHTIVQDQESSSVYGMPKAAAALGAATDILPVSGIAQKLVQLFN